MTIAGAIELALADVLRTFADPGAKTLIRAWQNLTDGQAEDTGERLYPMIDIRCSPPSTEDQVTRASDIMIMCGSYNEDDRNHAGIANLYEAAQTAVDALHDQFMAGEPYGAAYTLFTARLAELLEGKTFNLGGVSFSGSEPPFTDDGVNYIGIVMRVHYST